MPRAQKIKGSPAELRVVFVLCRKYVLNTLKSGKIFRFPEWVGRDYWLSSSEVTKIVTLGDKNCHIGCSRDRDRGLAGLVAAALSVG